MTSLVSKSRLVKGLLLGVLAVIAGCGGGGSSSGGTAWTQPTAGVVVATGAQTSGGDVSLLYVLSGDDAASATTATAGAAAGEGDVAPAITAVDGGGGRPFARITLTGSGFRTADSAVSVVFRAPDLPPVAVPALGVTSRSVEVTVPPLFTAGGENVSAHATVQVVQVGTWGSSTSSPFDGLDVSALPAALAGVPAGTVLDAYLEAACSELDYLAALHPGALPDSFWTAMATQRGQLASLRTAVQQVMASPAATPSVPTSGGPGTVTLSAAALTTADRLVLGMLQEIGPALGATSSGALRAGRAAAAVAEPECPSLGAPATDAQICTLLQTKTRSASLASKLVAIGAKFELGFSLGLFGGMITATGALSTQAEVAFELAWSALSGHLAAWATSVNPPTTGETLADMGVTLVDRLAGTQGILAAVYSSVGLGREFDAVVRDPPVSPPPPPANPWVGTWSGTYTLTINDAVSGCTFHHGGGALVNLYGTPGAYSGDYVLGGVKILNETCGLDSVISISGDLASVTTSGTSFSAVAPDPSGEDIHFSGTLAGTRLSGTLTVPDGSGTFTLTRQ